MSRLIQKSDRVFVLPFELAKTPIEGEVRVNRFWACAEEGPIFWKTLSGHFSPQCNADESVFYNPDGTIRDYLVRGFTVSIRKIDVVFTGHAEDG